MESQLDRDIDTSLSQYKDLVQFYSYDITLYNEKMNKYNVIKKQIENYHNKVNDIKL